MAGVKHLAEQIAVHHHLFTSPDDAVMLVIGMRHAGIPGDEPMGPGHTVDRPRIVHPPPARELVRPGQNHMFPGRRLETNRRLRRAARFHPHAFAIHTAANDDHIPRACGLRCFAHRLPGPIRRARPVIAGLRMLLRHLVVRGRKRAD